MKFIILKRAYVFFSLIILALCMICSTPLGENSISAVFFGDNLRKIPIYNVDTQDKKVAITFDAAWGADKTEKIMQILKEYNANATFFLVGFWVDKYGEIVDKINSQGFEIGTHSNTHPDMAKLNKEQMHLELQESIDKIKKITNKEVSLFRAPFGSYNNDLIDTAESFNLYTIQWNVDSLDWKGLSGSEISTRVLDRVNPGSIILCHNNSDHILEALPIILDRLKMRGYSVVSVGELIYHENFTIDRAGVQKLNQ